MMGSCDRKSSQATDRTSLLLKDEIGGSKSTWASIGLPNFRCGKRGYPRHERSMLETQKQHWAQVDRRLSRLRWISTIQIVLGMTTLWNYLWTTNFFIPFVGFVGLLAVRMEKISWTIVYLLFSVLEFLRNILLAKILYARYLIPNLHFTDYEYFQMTFMVIETIFLIPLAFHAVITTPSKRYYIPR